MRGYQVVGRWLRTLGAVLIVTAVMIPDACAADGHSPKMRAREEAIHTHSAEVLDRRLHYVGQVWMAIANDASYGTSHGSGGGCRGDESTLRINWCPSFEFPGGTRIDYLYRGGFWVGGIIGNDTLVSTGSSQSGGGNEFDGFTKMLEYIPEEYSAGCGDKGRGKGLDQVYYCVYSDTAISPSIAGSHTPLGIEVTQVSHQSSDSFARDFIIFDFLIRNVSDRPIEKLYFGSFNDCDVYYQFENGAPYEDDISGFLKTWPNPQDPTFTDTFNIAWAADNDGDPDGDRFPRVSARGVMGLMFLRAPAGSDVSFNWWSTTDLDWGPRLIENSRGFGTGGLGVPRGDRNKHFIMGNKEQDYGQLFSMVDLSDQGWEPPPGPLACNLADGSDTRSVLSAGPEEVLEPGEETRFTMAFLGGDRLHRFVQSEFDCLDPDTYVNNFDFSDLAKNAWWARFVFDNYGVDTDGDDYAGEFYRPVKGIDTVWYSGDGCPDFTGPKPPSGPSSENLTLVSRPLELEVTWVGDPTELEIDPFLRTRDFEGYQLYFAERNSPNDIPAAGDYSLLASWDIVNYRRYTYEPRSGEWLISSDPKTIAEWREVFKDNACVGSQEPFDPRDYPNPSLGNSYCYLEIDQFDHPVERNAYFEPQGFNQGNLIQVGDRVDTNLIQKIGTRTVVQDTDTLEVGVYRAILKDLLPSKHYFVTVTAMDYGDPGNNLDPLETTPGTSRVDGIPIYSADVVEEYNAIGGAFADSVKVVAYPNPYKGSFLDASGHRTSYAEQGFEGRFGQDISSITDADRRIHFINVPDTATIRIFTLDGDLVRELHHPDPNLSPYSSKISWDLVSRNLQAVESGIYIYRVDSKLGAQIGKIVIIK